MHVRTARIGRALCSNPLVGVGGIGVRIQGSTIDMFPIQHTRSLSNSIVSYILPLTSLTSIRNLSKLCNSKQHTHLTSTEIRRISFRGRKEKNRGNGVVVNRFPSLSNVKKGEEEWGSDHKEQEKQQARQRRLKLLITLSGIVATAYIITHFDQVPISGRRRIMLLSEAAELRQSHRAYVELLMEFKGRILPDSHHVSKLVRDTGMRIVNVSGLEHLDWKFHVVNSSMVNCFVLPGGKVFVFGGMLKLTESIDALAAVLGHEIGHAVARHAAEKNSEAIFLNFFYPVVSLIFNIDPFLVSAGMVLGMELPFSRRCESEADYIGMILMARACFNPEAAVSMWQKMETIDKTNRGLSKYLSTHPSHKDRISQTRRWLEEALKERRRCCKSRFSGNIFSGM